MENMKKQKIHYAWWILVACCIMQFGGLGIIVNAATIFLPAIKSGLGFTTAEYSTYIMFHQFSQAFTLPISGRVLTKAKNNNPIILATIGLLISNGILVILDQPWQWYVAGAAKGIFGAFLFMTLAPMVLKRWFKEKTGFAVGLASAFSGIGGALISPVGIALIESRGWQFSMITLTIIAAIALLPSVLFILKLRPEFVGMRPYGDTDEEVIINKELATNSGVDASSSYGLTFALILAISVLLSYVVGFNGHTIQIGTSLGLTTMAASFVVSASMFGNIFCKLLIGLISEKFSSYHALLTIMIMVMIGLAGYILIGGGSFIAMLISGFLYGGCMALNAVGLPLLVGDFYSGTRYDMILSYAMMFSMSVIGVAMTVFGIFYDKFNTYLPLMVIGIGVYIFMIFLMTLLYRRRNKVKQ